VVEDVDEQMLLRPEAQQVGAEEGRPITGSGSGAGGSTICTGPWPRISKRVRSTSCRRTISLRLAAIAATSRRPRRRAAPVTL
jgi:hypothetical protein